MKNIYKLRPGTTIKTPEVKTPKREMKEINKQSKKEKWKKKKNRFTLLPIFNSFEFSILFFFSLTKGFHPSVGFLFLLFTNLVKWWLIGAIERRCLTRVTRVTGAIDFSLKGSSPIFIKGHGDSSRAYGSDKKPFCSALPRPFWKI